MRRFATVTQLWRIQAKIYAAAEEEMISAGRFEVDVTRGGYPVDVYVYLKPYNGGPREQVLRIEHAELSDLKYVVQRAINEARRNLGPDRQDEVMK
jgi:hypothetical protein